MKAAFLVVAFLVLEGCSLMGFFETPPEICDPGDLRQMDCVDESGLPGTRERSCRDDGTWSEWGTCRGSGCDPGEVEVLPCEEYISNRPTQQTRRCLDDGTWSEWSDCRSIERCSPGDSRVDEYSCGPCTSGSFFESCDEEGYWSHGTCRNNPYDADEDGFAAFSCFEFRDEIESRCCGELDCDDDCWECQPGHVDVPGNDLDESCSGIATDQDGDGLLSLAEGGEDCHDRDPLRWLGNADLDEDGHELEGCGGGDCDDDCADCHPGAPTSCRDALDHDCSGVVDVLGECDACVPGTPTVVASLELGLDLESIFVAHGFAYICRRGGLAVVDVTTPEAPELVAELDDLDPCYSAFVQGDRAYVSVEGSVVQLDLSTPGAPEQIASIPIPYDRSGNPQAFAVGRHLYVTHNTVYLEKFDISMADRPYSLNRFGGISHLGPLFATRHAVFTIAGIHYGDDLSGYLNWNEILGPVERGAIFALRDTVYLVGPGAFHAMDISAAPDVEVLGDVRFNGTLQALFVSGAYAYAAGTLANSDDTRYLRGLHIFDVSNPSAIEVVDSVDDVSMRDVFVARGHAFLVGEDPTEPSGLFVIDLDCEG